MTSPNRPFIASTFPPQPKVSAPARIPEIRGTVAFMSEATRKGDWAMPSLFRAVAIMGSVTIDLTTARISPGTSRIEVAACMAGVTILLPPDVRVECDGDSIMGTFDLQRETASTTSPAAPMVLISGTSVMSAVLVKVIDPNAPSWVEKMRARWLSNRQ